MSKYLLSPKINIVIFTILKNMFYGWGTEKYFMLMSKKSYYLVYMSIYRRK